MIPRDALLTPARRLAAASRGPVHTTVGASEFGYRRVRSAPARYRAAAATVTHLPASVRENGIDVASAVEPYLPSMIRRTAACRLERARQRRNDLTERGEAIVREWRSSAALRDVVELMGRRSA